MVSKEAVLEAEKRIRDIAEQNADWAMLEAELLKVRVLTAIYEQLKELTLMVDLKGGCKF